MRSNIVIMIPSPTPTFIRLKIKWTRYRICVLCRTDWFWRMQSLEWTMWTISDDWVWIEIWIRRLMHHVWVRVVIYRCLREFKGVVICRVAAMTMTQWLRCSHFGKILATSYSPNLALYHCPAVQSPIITNIKSAKGCKCCFDIIFKNSMVSFDCIEA